MKVHVEQKNAGKWQDRHINQHKSQDTPGRTAGGGCAGAPHAAHLAGKAGTMLQVAGQGFCGHNQDEEKRGDREIITNIVIQSGAEGESFTFD